MATYPASLPQEFSTDGYEESPPDNILRTKMDKGPDKIRRRTTANIRPIKTTLRMTGTQVETLETFYVTTLLSGSLTFDWVEPRSGTTAEYRFVKPPKYTALGSDFWGVAFDLEQMP